MEEMNIEELEVYRQKLLKLYHTKKEELEFAMDDMEIYFIDRELEKYRVKIKACRARIDELKVAEV